MSRILVFCCALAVIAPSAADAQLLSLGLRGGASQSTMSLSSGSPASRTGIVVGPTGVVWLSDALAVQFDALYVGKGFKPNTAGGVTSALKLSYIDIPIVAVFSLPKAGSSTIQLRLQAGGTFGFRVQCSVDQGTGDVTGITDCNPDNVGTFDFGAVGGAGVKIGKGRGGIVIDATYTFGLLDANLDSGQSARNRAFQISAGFLFPIM
ncbi:MAG: PorT family protein [Gemmatimonadota bacterium]|nr:PorT family protein [Gemmatimonadota bacterium]MDH5196575.1 PorT family protein [Gemmatimonadota bacterium]